MSREAARDARRALNRFRRAVRKGVKELDALEGALRHAESDDFPEDVYRDARSALAELDRFAGEEGERLRQKVLLSGGLEPGRVRRASES